MKHEGLINQEQIDKVKVENKFTQSFFERHKNFSEQYKKNHEECTDEMITRLLILKDLRQEFMNFGFEELEVPAYKKNDSDSDITLKIDTVNLENFEVNLKLEGPEIIIKINTGTPLEKLKLSKELQQLFNLLKEKGLFISPIFLVGKDEVSEFESPESPPKLPPSAKEISDAEWRNINEQVALDKSSLMGHSEKIRDELSETFWNWPRLGARGLRTKYGLMNGALIFCDGKTAIFDTTKGKMEVLFSELLDPFGYDYGGKRKAKEKIEQQQEDKKEKQKFLP